MAGCFRAHLTICNSSDTCATPHVHAVPQLVDTALAERVGALQQVMAELNSIAARPMNRYASDLPAQQRVKSGAFVLLRHIAADGKDEPTSPRCGLKPSRAQIQTDSCLLDCRIEGLPGQRRIESGACVRLRHIAADGKDEPTSSRCAPQAAHGSEHDTCTRAYQPAVRASVTAEIR